MTARLPFTELAVRRAIAEAEGDGKRVSAVTVKPDGSVVVVAYPTGEGPIHRAPRIVPLADAAAYCRCCEPDFRALVKEGLLPRDIGRQWDRKALDLALAKMDMRPGIHCYESVYFITDGRFIKIGFSGSVEVRLQAIQASTPYDLTLIGSIHGGEQVEQRIHSLFPHLRHRGEWFRQSPGLLAYIHWLMARGRP